jgi:hypothetical protein
MGNIKINNMEKEFVPYEQALALKELGFDEPCFGYYISVQVRNPFLVIEKVFDTQGGYFTFAPLYQQAFRWFRDKYGLIGWVEGKIMFMYRIESPIESDGQLNCSPFRTYEEAELECLKKLIEIVNE